MNNDNDEALQQQAEAGDTPHQADVTAYRHVFRALRAAPLPTLPDTFADLVLMKIERRQAAVRRAEYFWLGAGLLVLVVAFIIAVVVTGFRPQWGFLENLAPFRGLILFAAVFVLFLHWADKKLLRSRAATRE